MVKNKEIDKLQEEVREHAINFANSKLRVSNN